MRWKTSHHGHDPRLNDLLAILALLVLIVGAWQYFGTQFRATQQSGLHRTEPKRTLVKSSL